MAQAVAWEQMQEYWIITITSSVKNGELSHACIFSKTIWHVNNIPTMQIFTGISIYTQSKTYLLSSTECVREFRYNALWDTH